ncbi:MarR family transcriptional regulator [Streptomyces sp. NBC_00378]|uniref:MarR family transcriptional regulator n=1 Tax=unclassified Streptomyces TaxID=2593676 RepID=UPI002255FE94|nr:MULTISPECIES: MarR family transcriptional regulator [unclassified Streptomyces]MCX5111485.1 MarR family transcriptional regulator [Streptomyces sp. NBC_00378]
MVVSDLSPAPCASASSRAHPKAKPGYGKRSVPAQHTPHEGDFALLPERERHIAGYVDALPDGAAMDIKSLARSQPLYGQMAVGSALRALGVAGHLRHVRCLSGENGEQVRWVTRTFWSRTARDNEWWNAFLTAEERHPAPQEAAEAAATSAPEVPASVPVPAQPLVTTVPQQRTAEPEPVLMLVSVPDPVSVSQATAGRPSSAFLALAHLGRADSRLALSAADCAALEQMAAEWFARGVDADYLTHALTAGLPASVDSPFGFVRRRLRDKLPPRLPAASPAAPGTPVRRLMVECTECGAPGRPEAFRDGLCRPCREPDPA